MRASCRGSRRCCCCRGAVHLNAVLVLYSVPSNAGVHLTATRTPTPQEDTHCQQSSSDVRTSLQDLSLQDPQSLECSVCRTQMRSAILTAKGTRGRAQQPGSPLVISGIWCRGRALLPQVIAAGHTSQPGCQVRRDGYPTDERVRVACPLRLCILPAARTLGGLMRNSISCHNDQYYWGGGCQN
jgi:hypothetical protein